MDDEFKNLMIAHVQKTEKHMDAVNAHMVQARLARAAHDKSINCLKDNFVAFKNEYMPQLKEALERKKFWQDIIDTHKKRSVLWIAGALTVLAVYGAGHAAALGAKKFAAFLAALAV